jgi:WD40 repeat protein
MAYGGQDKKVYIQDVEEDSQEGQSINRSEPRLAMAFNSKVTKIQFVGGKYLLALSEDCTAQMMDIDTEKVTDF